MAISTQFYEMMPDTITVYATATTDKYGKQTWSGSGTSIRCRLIFKTEETRDAEGKTVLANGRAICYGPLTTATTAHRLVLPDGTSPRILSVETIKDETEQNHHTVIVFGK